MSVDFLIFVAVKDCDFTSSCGYKNRRSFLNVYIIERLVLSHIFYFNRYNSCLSPCIFVVFITCVIYNLHVVGKKSLIDIPHWPEHYEVLSYHFWPAYRQNRLSVFVPEDRCIPLGEIWQRGAFWFPVRQNDSSLSGAVRFPPHVQHGIKRLSASGKDTSCLRI